MLAALELVVPVLARRNPRRAKTRAMSERASITPRNSSVNCVSLTSQAPSPIRIVSQVPLRKNLS